jgi:serine/threonine protein kinase/TolA-binding protein
MLSRLERSKAGKKDLHLGWKCFKEQRYPEAEQLFQQSAQEREKVLGKENVNTLDSKYWLAVTLYKQQKYPEAEQQLRQSVQEREKVLGTKDVDTLDSKYWLALTLYKQDKYSEAEQQFRQSVQEREKVLNTKHVDTLDSKYWLAITLYKQQKYPEAEQQLRQLIQEREKVLGKENVDTLDSKYWLAVTLHDQQKYSEAEQLFRQSIQERGKVLGTEHKDTIDSKLLLQKLLLAITPPVSVSTTTEKTVLSRLSDFFVEGKEGRAQYTDLEIGQVSLLLNHLNPQWSKVPRTYIILRTISCLNLLDQFIDHGFSDHWFPVTERILPYCLRPSHRSEFVGAQDLVITKSMGLEKGEEGQHCYFRRNELLPFEVKGILGSGGFGQVDKVLSSISFKEYARKRVPRNKAFGGQGTEGFKQFVTEIEILKRLKHHHVVEFVGSYTDPRYMGLIMSPVAEMDLSTYLARADTAKYGELRTFFGCLARALEFLHEHNVRHKDIKPGNILVHRGNVLFTDFGLSFDFTDADGSTTVSMVNGMTRRYCAPEVAALEPRNTASDIWSLGVVFLEMIAVLKGKTVEFMYEFFKRHGSRQDFVRTNRAGLLELVAELEETGNISDNRTLEWVQQMLLTDQQLRQTAAALVASIIAVGKQGDGNGSFCGICCMSLDDDFSDAVDELEDNVSRGHDN